MSYDCGALGVQFVFLATYVGACAFKENVPIGTFNISFESTQNKQQYGTIITCHTGKWGGGGGGGGGLR